MRDFNNLYLPVSTEINSYVECLIVTNKTGLIIQKMLRYKVLAEYGPCKVPNMDDMAYKCKDNDTNFNRPS